MILAAVFGFFSLVALLLILYFAKGYHATDTDLTQLASQLQRVDVNAFRNLIDEREELYLRENLGRADFRSIQRERKLAAIEYVRRAASNAAILIQLAESARQNSDPAIASAAEKLLENAFRLRLYCFRIVPRLYVSILLPSAILVPTRVADSYDTMTRQVVMLGLHYPTQGIASGL